MEEYWLAAVVTADLVSSTEMRVAVGDRQATAVERRLRTALRESASQHNGGMARNTGDGLTTIFATASAAVATAIEFHLRAAELGREVGVAIELRVGVAIGEVTGRLDEPAGIDGLPLLVSARLCGEADVGTTLCAEAVLATQETWPAIEVGAARAVELRGMARPVRACTVVSSDSADRLPPALARAGAGPFYGRFEEMTLARKVVARLGAEHRPLVLALTGPPGIGKTRTAAEICRSVPSSAVFVETTVTDAGPYRTLSRLFDETLDIDLATAAVESREQSALFARVLDAVNAVDEHPSYVVDDAHRLGRSERDLLVHLALHATRPLLFVLTSRTPLDDLDQRLGRSRAHEIVLGPVGVGASRTLVRAMLPAISADGPTIDSIVERSEGNPYVLRLFARAAALDAWAGEPPDVDRNTPTEVIERWLADSDPASTTLLRAAAVIGYIDPPLLADLFDLSSEAVDRALTAAVEVAVLAAGNGYRFTHSLVAESLAERMSADDAGRLHREVVALLRSRPEIAAGVVATHAVASDLGRADVEAACLDAAAESLRQAAPAGAATWYRHAADHAGSDDEAVTHLIRAIGAEHISGRPGARSEAHRLARECLDRDRPELAAEALFAVDDGMFSFIGFADPALIGLAEEILARLDPAGEAHLRLTALLAAELTFAGAEDRQAQRQALATQATDGLAAWTGDPVLVGTVLGSCAVALRGPDSIPERRKLVGRLVEVADGIGDDWLSFLANQQLGAAALEHLETVQADECVDLAIRHANLLGQPRARWIANIMATARAINHADLDGAEELRLQALVEGARAGQTFEHHIPAVEQSLEIHRWRGTLTPTTEHLASWAGNPELDFALNGLKYLALIGPDPIVTTWLDQHDPWTEASSGPAIVQGPKLVNLATVLLAHDRRDALEMLYPRLVDLDRTWFQTTVSLGCTAHHCARVAAHLGRAADAEHYYLEALDIHDVGHAPIWWAETVVWAEASGVGLVDEADVTQARAIKARLRALP